MSKLIRDPENNKRPIIPEVTLDDAGMLRLLKACQAMAVERGRSMFGEYLEGLDDALDESIDKARSNQDVVHLTQLQKQFRQATGELERYFCGYLAEGFVKFRKKQLNTTHHEDADHAFGLALVENEKLEESLAIGSISQRADAYYAEPLWALNRRLSVINHGESVAEESNPAAPIQICESLRRTLKLIPLDARSKTLIYRIFDEHLFPFAGSLIVDMNDYLKHQGVLPHLSYTLPAGTAPKSYLSKSRAEKTDPTRSGDLDETIPAGAQQTGDLVGAIRDLQSLLSGGEAGGRTNESHSVDVSASSSTQGRDGEAAFYTVKQLVEALADIQGHSLSLATAGDKEALAPADMQVVLEALSSRLGKEEPHAINRNEMQTIDLVGMLFEYMLNDENLPDAVKALLSYLHTPFLKLAFVDPGFFEQSEHPARLLLNNLAEAGARWVGNDGSSQYGIYEKIKEIVDRVLRDFDNDVRVIAELLLEFSSHTKHILRRQELMEKRATEKAQGEEKLRAVKLQVNEAVRVRIEGRELPSAVLLLLLQPWSDFLSFTLLRYGDNSDKWQESLAVVDNLIWCVEPKQTADDRSRQQELRKPVIETLEAGLNTIGYDQTKARQVIDSVSSLMKQVMQRKAVEPASAPERSELERIAAEKAGDQNNLEQKGLTAEERQIIDSLKMIEFGTWFEFENGERLKVAWYNKRTSHYMLVDQMGKRAAMMSNVEMARAMVAGKAKVIAGSSKPFFDRALENILQKLNARAEALDPKEAE